MKRNIRYMIALAGAVTMFAGCVEENLEETIKVKEGDEIIFGARAGYENNDPSTKTIYKGTTYQVGDKTLEAVHWMPGDKVMIYCDQGNQTAHYQVTATGTGSNTEAETSLQKMQLHGVGNNGVQWKNIKENDHTFYAVYPSPYQFSTPNVESGLLEASNYQERITGDGTKLNCYLPVSQAPSSIEVKADGSGYIAHPNMNYAYMIAKQVVKANANGEVPAGVDLDFRPIVTALEVTMTFPEDYSYEDGSGNDIDVTYSDLTISNVRLETTDGSPIVGPFSLDLAEYEYSSTEVTYPDVTIPQSAEALNTVGVQLYRDVNGVPTPLTIGTNQTLTFTVFMLPTEIDNLKIFVDLKSGSLGNLKIEAHKKQFLVNLVLPATSSETQTSTTTGSNWISQLPEDVLIDGLSIPGTANSFSYNYKGGGINNDATEIDNNYMTQTLSFDSQWNLGVRCFELVCDRINSTAKDASLATAKLKCNKEDLGLSVNDAFDKILEKLTANGNEKEFAMVIVTYQPEGNTIVRNPTAFMTQLKNFYDNYSYDNKDLSEYTCLYKPGLTLDEVRKTPLMIIARPSQEGEDDANEVDAGAGTGYNILTVKGWGTLPDKWTKRGYKTKLFKGVGGNAANELYQDNIEAHADYPAMEDWIYGPTFSNQSYIYYYLGGTRPTAARPEKNADIKLDYSYMSDQGYEVWAQEWRRVAQKTETISFSHRVIFSSVSRTAQWEESFIEKKSDILDCLIRSVASEKSRVYINSMDGFYITPIEDSCDHYYFGNMGDIGGYADDINAWFYPELLKYSATDVTGPLGVIIMDRVAHTGAGSFLPEVIYMNNWRHTLETSKKYPAGSAEVEDWTDESLN
mgnify:CR=1 FL=1